MHQFRSIDRQPPHVGFRDDLQFIPDVSGPVYRPTSGNGGPLVLCFHGGGDWAEQPGLVEAVTCQELAEGGFERKKPTNVASR